jgi:hypothetical protein
LRAPLLRPKHLNAVAADDNQLTWTITAAALIVADMTATTFCDPNAMHSIATARRLAVAAGADMRLVIGHPGGLVLRGDCRCLRDRAQNRPLCPLPRDSAAGRFGQMLMTVCGGGIPSGPVIYRTGIGPDAGGPVSRSGRDAGARPSPKLRT